MSCCGQFVIHIFLPRELHLSHSIVFFDLVDNWILLLGHTLSAFTWWDPPPPSFHKNTGVVVVHDHRLSMCLLCQSVYVYRYACAFLQSMWIRFLSLFILVLWISRWGTKSIDHTDCYVNKHPEFVLDTDGRWQLQTVIRIGSVRQNLDMTFSATLRGDDTPRCLRLTYVVWCGTFW